MSARSRTTAGSRERGRPRAIPGVLCEKPLLQQTRARSHSHPLSLFCVSHDISSVQCSFPMISDLFRARILGTFSGVVVIRFTAFLAPFFVHTRIPASLEPRSHGQRWSLFTKHTSLLVSSIDNPSQVNVSATTAPRRPRFAEQPHGSFVSVKTHTSSRSSGHYMRDDLLSTTIALSFNAQRVTHCTRTQFLHA